MFELTLKAIVDNLPKVTDFIDGHLEACDCPMKAQLQIDIAIDELFANIAHYAYGDAVGDATVQFDFDPSDRIVSVTFMDHGVPFDPLQSAEPDVTLSAEEREIGGLGIFLVKKTMDNLTYRYENGMNILNFTKRI